MATLGTIIVTSLIAAAVLVVILFIGFKSKKRKDDSSETAKTELEEKQAISGERKDKAKTTGKGKRGNAPVKNHRRQFAILKGHTGDVFDLEFSLNGKYMASTSQGSQIETNISSTILAACMLRDLSTYTSGYIT